MTYQDICREIANVEDSHGKRAYDEREARAVARILLEDVLGFTLADIYGGKQVNCSADFIRAFNLIRQGVPVQYAVGKALFADRYFKVTKGVLIPRPETQELCLWVAEDCKTAGTILDIGTGSGCIAITLALETKAKVTAWDIANEAFQTAKTNAQALGADVTVEQQDALKVTDDGRRWDVIVSNPPYICQKEKVDMEANVVDHEPSIALFVPDSDPLMFYRAITRYASTSLNKGGCLFFEINPLYAKEMETMAEEEGFAHFETREDQYGKKRMMKIWKE